MKTAAQVSKDLNLYLPEVDPQQEVSREEAHHLFAVSIAMTTCTVDHVLVGDKRAVISPEELEAFGLTNGQEVTAEEFQRIRAVRNAS